MSPNRVPASSQHSWYSTFERELHPFYECTWSEIFPAILSNHKVNKKTYAQKYLMHETSHIEREQAENVWQDDDPQRSLGPGIAAYHDFLVNMGMVITLMFIFHIPIMIIYGSYGFFDSGVVQELSLGNLGFSQNVCEIEPVVSFDKITLGCNAGHIDELVDFGITTQFEDQQGCSRNVGTHYFNQFMRDQDFETFFRNNCKDKKECIFDGQDMKEFMDLPMLPDHG